MRTPASVAACLLLVGSLLGQSGNPDDTFKHIGVFSEVVSYIKDQYVEEPDMKSVTLGALNGLLEAVADAEHEPAIGGELADSRHDRRELGDGPATEVVAVGEAAGEDDGIDARERGGIVPDELGGLPEVMRDRVEGIVVAVATGEDNDAKFHAGCLVWGVKY